MTLEQTY